MTTLVIVESPGKVKKISGFLGGGYRVVASVGHVRDLPKRAMGIEPPEFVPQYEPTERGKEVLQRLAKEVRNSSAVLLATDPDREGEAIAWHLKDALQLRNAARVTFTAITKEKVLEAIASPRTLDMPRVRSQEARRALDRIVGYRVSRAISDHLGENLTAGRVQSPAVRLVVDRERAITTFKPTEHYGAELEFSNPDGTTWKAVWDTKPHLTDGTPYLLNQALAIEASKIRHVCVLAFEDADKTRAPGAPFTTSTLQQAASQRLKLRPQRTMELAQRLYEQGAITYHRTDNPNLDAAGINDIAAYAKSANLSLASKPRRWKLKEGAQEGHEAIRPTHADQLKAGESEEEAALYQLIWQRAVASQLASAVYAVRSVRLAGEAGEFLAEFIGTGRTLKSSGWMTVYAADEDAENDDADNPIPALARGSRLVASQGRSLTKQTKPPARFTEASLVKEMEKLGIGRPSTYAAIMENISSRAYVTEDKERRLHPSVMGEKIRDALVGKFAFVDLDFTRNLETDLDHVAEGEMDYRAIIAKTWVSLDSELSTLSGSMANPAHPCPSCGKALSRRKGSNGFFWACVGYPDCKVTLPDARGKPGARKAPPAPTGIACPKCGKELARRKGKSAKKGNKPARAYDFYSCTGYPSCDATYPTGPDGKPVLA